MNRRPSQFDLQQMMIIFFVCAVVAAIAGYAVRNVETTRPAVWIIAAAAAPMLVTIAVRLFMGFVALAQRSPKRRR